MQITGETVTGAVVRVLVANFKNSKVYKEDQVQKLVRPCFFVKQITLQQEKQMNRRDRRTYRIRIQALPPSGEASPEVFCRDVGEALLGLFRLLPLSETESVFGRNMEYEVVNGELIFTVEYSIWVELPPAESILMNTLDTNETLKA